MRKETFNKYENSRRVSEMMPEGKAKGRELEPSFPKTKDLVMPASETAQGEHSPMADENILGLFLPILGGKLQNHT